ncbi:MAG: polyphosphate kinase 2 family protein [Luteolibacter sp.]
MPASGAVERYCVKPGSKVNFDDWNPNEKSLFKGESKQDYVPQFEHITREIQRLQKVLYAQNKHRILVVIQAMDTGGKDGCVKDVFSGVDPQGIHVQAFKKPTEEELAHDFLWRIHDQVPRNGQIVIFNRSHYEDIIAVRVKKIYPDEVWQRRQQHVVDFERMLAEEGTTIIKIFLNISKEEQKARLESRLANPAKHWKFHPEDLADRARWSLFMEAYEDVIGKTSTEAAPWYIVPADRKWYRNLVVGRIMLDTLKKLNMEFPQITWDPIAIKIED